MWSLGVLGVCVSAVPRPAPNTEVGTEMCEQGWVRHQVRNAQAKPYQGVHLPTHNTDIGTDRCQQAVAEPPALRRRLVELMGLLGLVGPVDT